MLLQVTDIINRLGLDIDFLSSGECIDRSPVNGKTIASFPLADAAHVQKVIDRACFAFNEWRGVSPTDRADLIRIFIEELIQHKEDLITLIMIETGKIRSSAEAEVNTTISICESVAGIPKLLAGLSCPTQDQKLTISQTWLPLGPVGVITSFNFPLRVWAHHALMALICGNSVIWRPSRKATLTAFAINTLLRRAKARSFTYCPEYLSQILICDHAEGQLLAQSERIPLLCVTGAPTTAKKLQHCVSQRFGRVLSSIGGNNAAIVMPSANLNLAITEIGNSIVADCGQRATSLKRVYVHRKIYDTFVSQLKEWLNSIHIDSPFEPPSKMGPLIDKEAFSFMQYTLSMAEKAGAKIFGGERMNIGHFADAYYVKPALIECEKQIDLVLEEILAPMAFVIPFDDLHEAINNVNAFSQTLLSCLFTNNLQEVGNFTSDFGVSSAAATVNAGTVGYDLEAMFRTGKNGNTTGTIENSWKMFMQSKTCLVNYNA
ncbi:MAG: aldehyde dehydrogenase family protein [Alphaproteobacteria bacterium]|nr:aldehyde dehydrogenase family protein [Alphaproteobacteria bacterium]